MTKKCLIHVYFVSEFNKYISGNDIIQNRMWNIAVLLNKSTHTEEENKLIENYNIFCINLIDFIKNLRNQYKDTLDIEERCDISCIIDNLSNALYNTHRYVDILNAICELDEIFNKVN